MEFRVLNEYQAWSYKEETKHVFISIRSPYADPVMLPDNKNRFGQIFLQFHDLDHLPEVDKICLGVSKPYNLFTDKMAEDILKIASMSDDIETIIVNCEAGISRSAGVVAALANIINEDDSRFFKKYLPKQWLKIF